MANFFGGYGSTSLGSNIKYQYLIFINVEVPDQINK